MEGTASESEDKYESKMEDMQKMNLWRIGVLSL